MKLIYIANKDVSVFGSQVVALLNHVFEYNDFDEIILMLGINYKTGINQNEILELDKRIIVKYYRHYPQYPIIEQKTINSITKLLSQFNNLNEYVIHVRNDVLAYYTYKALLKSEASTENLIADIRGAGLEQMLEYSNKNRLIKKLKIRQRQKVFKSFQKIKNISVVSNSLKKYIHNHVHNTSIYVNSCLANRSFKFNRLERIKTRESIDIKDDEVLIVLSTGGNNAWQNTENSLKKIAELKYKVLNLSKYKIKHPNVINLFVPYIDVAKYLSAADIAIIWREPSITNQVASPVKFSEYVACGLPVITNNSIDLITEYIKSINCGLIVDSINDIDNETINCLIKLDRDIISRNGIEAFGIDTIAKQYLNLYRQII